jgi:hypothetical protein
MRALGESKLERISRLLVLGLCVQLAVPSAAKAAEIYYSTTVSTAGMPLNGNNYLYWQFPRFNENWGILHSVSFFVSASFEVSAAWDETAMTQGRDAIAATFNQPGVYFPYIWGALSPFEDLGIITVPNKFVLPGEIGGASSGMISSGPKTLTVLLNPDTAEGIISELAGTGYADLVIEDRLNNYRECLSITGCGTVTFSSYSIYDVAISYNYTPLGIPEPGQWILAILGLFAAGSIVRGGNRRRSEPLSG